MKITLNTPAKRWKEAFPIGNGHLGGMIFAGEEEDRIELSEQTFFSGDAKAQNYREGAKEAFEKMRRETLNGDYRAAKKTAEQVMGIRGNYGTNLPVGTVIIKRMEKGKGPLEFCRSLSLLDGMAEAAVCSDKGRIRTQAFASHPDNVLVYRLEAQKRQDLFVSFQSFRQQERILYEKEKVLFFCRALEEMHSDGTTGTELEGRIYLDTDGKQRADNDGIYLEQASYLCLSIRMATDFYKSPGSLEAPEGGFEEIKRNHQEDFASYMERSALEIEADPKDLETKKIPFLYQLGRYLLLSSSREDSALPAHLQGIWNDNVACRIGWTCDMHLDVNTQMNYWPGEVTGLPECTMPLFHWVKEMLLENGRKTARLVYGRPGWALELVSNAWGYGAPYWHPSLAPCPTGGVWLLANLFEHYAFTMDLDYLQELFPVLEEAVEFFLEYVQEDENGQLVGGPSISPENGFWVQGERFESSMGNTYETLMIRELYEMYDVACKALQKEGKYLSRAKKQKGRLLPYRILKDGTIAEYSHNYPPADPWHRHTSHLLGLYPFSQITPEDTALAAAAEKTIEGKITPEENWEDTGWARSMLMLYETRLLHPLQAYYHMKQMMKNLLEPGGLIIHPPTRGAGAFEDVYELDGNTGFSACVAEMLLQSQNGKIRILPCLPAEWKSGHVKGLMARGNIRTEIWWDRNGCKAGFLAYADTKAIICYKEERIELYLKAGKEERAAFLDKETNRETKK